MALITRVSRLFRADLHEVLDRIEEPDILLKQAIREMEEELGDDQRRSQVLAQELAQLDIRKTELQRTTSRMDEELDLCFASDKEDLARGLIKRKLEAERYLRFLENKGRGLDENRVRLGKRIEDNRANLEAMRQKAELLAPDHTGPDPDKNWADHGFEARFAVSDEDVEVALLRERQKRARS
jgi:phage shock protein A